MAVLPGKVLGGPLPLRRRTLPSAGQPVRGKCQCHRRGWARPHLDGRIERQPDPVRQGHPGIGVHHRLERFRNALCHRLGNDGGERDRGRRPQPDAGKREPVHGRSHGTADDRRGKGGLRPPFRASRHLSPQGQRRGVLDRNHGERPAPALQAGRRHRAGGRGSLHGRLLHRRGPPGQHLGVHDERTGQVRPHRRPVCQLLQGRRHRRRPVLRTGLLRPAGRHARVRRHPRPHLVQPAGRAPEAFRSPGVRGLEDQQCPGGARQGRRHRAGTPGRSGYRPPLRPERLQHLLRRIGFQRTGADALLLHDGRLRPRLGRFRQRPQRLLFEPAGRPLQVPGPHHQQQPEHCRDRELPECQGPAALVRNLVGDPAVHPGQLRAPGRYLSADAPDPPRPEGSGPPHPRGAPRARTRGEGKGAGEAAVEDPDELFLQRGARVPHPAHDDRGAGFPAG